MSLALNIKADSHIAYGTHAVPMPFPCPAVPLTVQNVYFLFFLHSAAVSDSHLPCHAHAAPMPCCDHAVLLKATAQHGRRETACGLPAGVRLLPATTRSCTKIVIRSIPILLTTIHTYDCKEWQQHTTKKTNCWTSVSDISVYHADFHEGTTLSGQGSGAAWHV